MTVGCPVNLPYHASEYTLAVSIAEDNRKDSKKGLAKYKTVRQYVREKLAEFVPEDENEN